MAPKDKKELPARFKNLESFKLDDEKTLLATMAAQNNVTNKHLNRIENNVVFFFWFIMASLVAAVLVSLAQTP